MSAPVPRRYQPKSTWLIWAGVGVAGLAFIVICMLMSSGPKQAPAPTPPPVVVAPKPRPAPPAEAPKPKRRPRPDINAFDTFGKTLLHKAAESGTPSDIRDLIEEGADVNLLTKSGGGFTPLVLAVLANREDNVKTLLDAGAKVDLTGAHVDATTPLGLAAGQGWLSIVMLLVEHGANVNGNARGSGDSTALSIAAVNRHMRVVQYLLEHGADVHKGAPLGRAASAGDMEMATFLLSKGVKVDERDAAGMTALFWGCNRNAVPMVNFLIERGADVNARTAYGDTVLHFSIGPSTAEVVGILLSHGADPTAKDKAGKTALERAIERNRPDLAAVMLEKMPASSQPALLLASAAGEDPKAVETLLDQGVPVNTCDAQGRTALHAAAGRSRTRVIAVLLKKGADVNAKDKTGKTPLMEAAECAWALPEVQVEAIRMLLAAGAKVNEACSKEGGDHSGWTPLHFAASSGSLEAARVLIEKGADVNLKTAKGETALALAEDRREVREYLDPLTKKPPPKRVPKRIQYVVTEGKVKYIQGSPEDRKGRKFKVVESGVADGGVYYIEEEVISDQEKATEEQ